MILNVSGRTDIVAFYSEWFINRYKEGFVDVRNPFNPKLVSRINFKDVDLILFCTKNPIPLLKFIKEINHPFIIHITLTPYKRNIEPNVPPKGSVIEAIKKLSKIVGTDKIIIRYDPVFINCEYTIEYHKNMFNELCQKLNGCVNKIIISFIDEYKNVLKNMNVLKIRKLTSDDYKELGISLSRSAKENNMTVQTCCEDNNLTEYGFIKDECLSLTLAFKLTGKIFNKWKSRKCGCAEMIDIGAYNTCFHYCKYCYANFDEEKVKKNIINHDKYSSLLIGKLEKCDIIKERIK